VPLGAGAGLGAAQMKNGVATRLEAPFDKGNPQLHF
jgi:hypothetical protein